MKKMKLLLLTMAAAMLLTACGGKTAGTSSGFKSHSVTEKKIAADLAEANLLTAEGLTADTITGVTLLAEEKDSVGQTLYEASAALKLGEISGTMHCLLTYSDGALLQAQVLQDTQIDPVPDSTLTDDAKTCEALPLGDLRITDASVDRVYSNTDVSVCYAEVRVLGEGEGFTAEYCVELRYMLTNSGWQLQDSVILTSSVVPAQGIDEEQARLLTAQYLGVDDWMLVHENTELALENGEEWITFTQNETYAYLTIYQSYVMHFVFSPDTLTWQLDGQSDAGQRQMIWDIEGRWSCTGDDTTVRVFEDTDYVYSFTADITDLGDGRFQIDFDLAPGFYNSNYKNGTVYFDTAEAEIDLYSGVWEMESDTSGGTYFWINAEDGLFAGKSGFSSYQLERN